MNASVVGIKSTVIGLLAIGLFTLAGCGQGTPTSTSKEAHNQGEHNQEAHQPETNGQADQEAKIRKARAELNEEDLRLVEAQEFCPVMEEHRLGVMGVPFKLMIEGQPVFLCCKGCKKEALADPDKTLAKVKELQAKVKASSGN
jgi:hypothetical protein